MKGLKTHVKGKKVMLGNSEVVAFVSVRLKEDCSGWDVMESLRATQVDNFAWKICCEII